MPRPAALCLALAAAAAMALWNAVPWRPPAPGPLLCEGGCGEGIPGEPATSPDRLSRGLARARGDPRAEAGVLADQVGPMLARGELQPGLQLLGKLRERWARLGERRCEAKALGHIAYVYGQLGLPRDARHAAKEALDLRRRAGFAPDPRVLLTLGHAHAGLKQWDLALQAYEEGLAACDQTHYLAFKPYLLQAIGMAHSGQGRPRQAVASLQEALSITRELEDERDERARGYALANLAEVHALGRQDWRRALPLLEEATKIFRSLDDPYVLSAALYGLGRAQLNTGRLEEGLRSFEGALALLERLRFKAGGGGLQSALVAMRHDHAVSFVDLLVRLDGREPGEGYAARGFEAAEEWRARALLDELRESREGIQRGVDSRLLELEREMAALDRQERAAHEARTKASEPSDELHRLATRYEEIKAEIRSSYPRYADLTRPEPLRFAAIRQLLDPGTVLLSYLLGEKQGFLWAVSSDAVEVHRIPGRDRLEPAIQNALDLLKRTQHPAHCDRAAHALRALRRTLLGPVEEDLRGRRLVIVADGALHGFPFGALPEPAAEKRPGACWPASLVARHEIAYLPSASVLALLRRDLEQRRPAPGAGAVVADPVYERDDERFPAARRDRRAGRDVFRRLFYAKKEAEMLQQRLPPESSFFARDFAANRRTVTGPELGRHRIVHFATHARIHPQVPGLSGLVLSRYDEQGRLQDGFLRLHEIYNLKLRADLVVLSACETGLGREVRGEGLIGMTRGFMYAGAPRVVASLWAVNDRATAELMDRFYEGLLDKDLTAAAALRQAQQRMSMVERWSAPYHWAGFVLQGEWR